MNAPRPEEAIVDAALEKPCAERAAYLDEACAGDAALRQLVEALIRAHERAPADPPSSRGSELSTIGPPSTLVSLPSSLEKPGDRIGRYKLLQQIGEGGGGVVYMAEQEEPVRRRVALKIIKLGMDTKQVVARFEAERQALALMDHPNIAKVHDAGATETGRPYFVMELVRGVKITDYCDQNNLPTAKRLDLFIQVCKAVQHAHQKGIIHRDIKPSNILVTLHDGVPVPKVIDFGIAKATTGQPLTDKTVFTAFEQFIGTPAYMSPEQAEMSGLDIDTRSDIYSLGVLLYELLTGQTPFDSKRLIRAGLDEVRRIIREEDPVRPSTRISALDAAEQTTVAKRRQTEAPKLIHLVRGDLDWIVMKCLEKDRARRYETANGLANDLQRHLDDEPVVARPPSRLYEVQKSMRRHWVGYAATAAVVVTLVISLGISLRSLALAREASRRESAARYQADIARGRETALRQQAEAREKVPEAKLLIDEGKYAEAERRLNQIPAAFVQPDPIHADARRVLAWWHALHEQWPEAATNYAVLMQVHDSDDWDSFTLDYLAHGVTLVQLAHRTPYENFRRTTIAQFHSSTNPIVAERISRMVLALPAGAEIMAAVEPLYVALTNGQAGPLDPDWRAWGCAALALIEYRRGQYDASHRWCGKVLEVQLHNSNRDPIVYAVQAMDCLYLGQEQEARVALENCQRTGNVTFRGMARRRPDENIVYRTIGLYDAFYRAILVREARTLVQGAGSAEGAEPIVEYSRARIYATGDGVAVDAAEADKWLRKAAGLGYVPAQLDLADKYLRGDGVPVNLTESVNWYHMAADQDDARGQFQLGSMYAQGSGVTKNLIEAAAWWRRSADHGYVQSQNSLAWLLATSPDAKLRDGTNAVDLAEKAASATQRSDPGILDTLAAAYAEVGQFEQAISIEKRAIDLEQDENRKKERASHLRIFQSGSPVRE